MNKSYELVEGLNNSDILNLYNDILEGDKLAECICYRSGVSSEYPSECWGGTAWATGCIGGYTITDVASCRSECTKRCGAGGYKFIFTGVNPVFEWIESNTNETSVDYSCWYNR